MSEPATKQPRTDKKEAQGYGANDGALAKGAVKYVVTKDGEIQAEGEGLVLHQTEGTFIITCASRISSLAVAKHAKRWSGVGMDWGCGGGCMGLICAREEKVSRVIGMDFDIPNVELSIRNAARNGLSAKTEWYGADSFDPFKDEDKAAVRSLHGKFDFVVANPPASSGDDGFAFRRRILREAPIFLKEGGLLGLQALSHYGLGRVRAAAEESNKCWAEQQAKAASPAPTAQCRFRYLGVAASSPWMEMGANYDMKAQLTMYKTEEERGGGRYYCGPDRRLRDVPIAKHVLLDTCDEEGFFDAEAADDQEALLTASQVMEMWETTGLLPLGRWQFHLFEFCRP